MKPACPEGLRTRWVSARAGLSSGRKKMAKLLKMWVKVESGWGMVVWFIFSTETYDHVLLLVGLVEGVGLLISLSRLAVTMARIWSSISPATIRLMLEVDSRSWLVMMPPPQPRSRASIEGVWARLERRSISRPGGPVTSSLVVTISWDGDAMVVDEMD